MGPSAPSLPQSAMTSPPRQRGEQPAERTPERRQAGALLGVDDPGEHVKAAGELLGVLPELARLQAAARRHREGEQAAAGVKRVAVGGGKAVDRSPPEGSHSASSTGRGQTAASASAVVVTPGAPLSAAMAISAIGYPLPGSSARPTFPLDAEQVSGAGVGRLDGERDRRRWNRSSWRSR